MGTIQWLGSGVQWAASVAVAAWLTHLFTRRLEDQRFKKKLEEIVHTNTHKRRMEAMEAISKAMGVILFKMSVVPEFLPDYEPLPPEQVEGSNIHERRAHRETIKAFAVGEHIGKLIEIVEDGYVYISPDNDKHVKKFIEEIHATLTRFHAERPGYDAKGKAMGEFKEDLQRLRELRKSINLDFRNQLRRPDLGE